MFNNVTKNQGEEESFVKQGEIIELEGKILALSGDVIALRIELESEHRKLASYFKILSKQVYEMRKDLDYIRTYLDVELEELESMDDEEWRQV